MKRILLACPWLLLACAGVARAQPLMLAARTLRRTEDTVVIPGEVLGPRILGAHKDRLRVYANRAGYMVPICFQIDERLPGGGYCYTGGPKDRRVRDVDRGLLDGNDELLVCVRDAGDRAAPQAFAVIPGFSAVQEIQLQDPLDGGLGWIYVFRFDGLSVPGVLQGDFVSLTVKEYSEEEKTYYWRGEAFAFNNDKSRRNAVRATFATLASRNETLEGKPNFLDSTQVRAVVSFMWVTVVRQSNDLRVDIGGILDGPLRMVSENLLKVYLALGLWVSAPESYIILWRNRVSMPTNADNPVNLDVSDESSYTLCMDLARGVKDLGWKFYNSRNPKPVNIDGRWSREERELDLTYPEWNCVFGPSGAMLSKFVVPKVLSERNTSRLVYIDDEYFKRPEDEEGIEFEPGAIGYHGYYVDMAGLKKGTYPGDYVVWYAPPPFGPGDERKLLDEYERPLLATRPEEAGASAEK